MNAAPLPGTAEPSSHLAILRGWVGAIAATGTLVFGALFAASWIDPLFVERLAKEVIRIEVQKEVTERIDAIDDNYLVAKAKRLVALEKTKIAEIQGQMRRGLPARVTAVLEQMRDASCACRTIVESYLGADGARRIAHAQGMIDFLDGMIRAKYMETAAQVTREFRVFTGSNALVFSLLGVAVFVKRRAGVHLIPATALLIGTAGLTAYLYLFNQDWLHTLVFGDYVGLAYLGYLAVVLILFADLMFNRGRGTLVAINLLAGILGAAASAIPC